MNPTAILQNLQTHDDLHTNPTCNSTKSSNLRRYTHKPGTLFYEIFKAMKIHTRTRHAIVQNFPTHDDLNKIPERYSTKLSNLRWSTHESITLFYKIFKTMKIYTWIRHVILQNLQNYEDPHTNPEGYSTESSNRWSYTQESVTLFYNILWRLHKNPARYSTKSSNPWWFTHVPDTLFYKIYKPMKIHIRVRQANSAKSSNLWRPTRESGTLFYKIFKPMRA